MSSVYTLIGRAVVRFVRFRYELTGRTVVGFVRYRYGDRLRVAALVGLGAAVLGALGVYAATQGDEQD
jgi:hypothetical protein